MQTNKKKGKNIIGIIQYNRYYTEFPYIDISSSYYFYDDSD